MSGSSERLSSDGFAFVESEPMRTELEAYGSLADWDVFAASWNRLAIDQYLATKGRARKRRHAMFAADATGAITLQAHQPHFQSLTYNTLQGDLERWFEPIELSITDSDTLRTILSYLRALFSGLAPQTRRWKIEVHQFRIEATAGAAGEPTPEGSHRDGVDYVCVLLVHRQNIASGTTTIHTPDGEPLGAFTLTHPLDAALVYDPKVFHGVTPVHPLVLGEPAFRDVLVVTFVAA